MEKTQNKTKNPIDYSKGKIYKIICNTTGLIYVGSTIQKLCERLSGHRNNYKLYLQGKTRFITSFDIIKNDNYEIILIDECPCNNKEQLLREERKYIESIECINKIIPTRTEKEYRENNKEEINEKKRENYKNTKGQQKKEYYEKNKKEIQEKQRIYRENSKEKYNERQKEYHQKHKQKRKIKVECEYCKTIIGKDVLRRHQRTNKCKKFQLSI